MNVLPITGLPSVPTGASATTGARGAPADRPPHEERSAPVTLSKRFRDHGAVFIGPWIREAQESQWEKGGGKLLMSALATLTGSDYARGISTQPGMLQFWMDPPRMDLKYALEGSNVYEVTLYMKQQSGEVERILIYAGRELKLSIGKPSPHARSSAPTQQHWLQQARSRNDGAAAPGRPAGNRFRILGDARALPVTCYAEVKLNRQAGRLLELLPPDKATMVELASALDFAPAEPESLERFDAVLREKNVTLAVAMENFGSFARIAGMCMENGKSSVFHDLMRGLARHCFDRLPFQELVRILTAREDSLLSGFDAHTKKIFATRAGYIDLECAARGVADLNEILGDSPQAMEKFLAIKRGIIAQSNCHTLKGLLRHVRTEFHPRPLDETFRKAILSRSELSNNVIANYLAVANQLVEYAARMGMPDKDFLREIGSFVGQKRKRDGTMAQLPLVRALIEEISAAPNVILAVLSAVWKGMDESERRSVSGSSA